MLLPVWKMASPLEPGANLPDNWFPSHLLQSYFHPCNLIYIQNIMDIMVWETFVSLIKLLRYLFTKFHEFSWCQTFPKIVFGHEMFLL